MVNRRGVRGEALTRLAGEGVCRLICDRFDFFWSQATVFDGPRNYPACIGWSLNLLAHGHCRCCRCRNSMWVQGFLLCSRIAAVSVFSKRVFRKRFSKTRIASSVFVKQSCTRRFDLLFLLGQPGHRGKAIGIAPLLVSDHENY